jgi:adenylate cyclase
MSFSSPPSQVRHILWFILIAAIVGGVYARINAISAGSPVLSFYGAPRGLLTGALIAAILSPLETFVFAEPLGALQRTSFPVHVAIKTMIDLVVILFSLWVSQIVFPTGPGIEHGDVLFSLGVSFVFAFMTNIDQLLGQNMLLNFVTGRYYRPRVESRVFLFVDMEGSTGFGERLGALGFHRLLNKFVGDLTEPIVAAGGEIHSYVGDELIATWTLSEGVARGRCVSACFGAMERLARLAPEYRREFGAAVNFRAGLHCGEVVAGEMGTVKKEIVFLGDTVNTAARIQEMCRATGDRVLASAELIDRLELPAGVIKRSLGDLRLRGKETDVALYALSQAGNVDTRST